MSDEERGRALPQRERGATRGGAAPAAVPVGPQVMTEDLRKRLQAAVQAERAQGAAQGQQGSAGQPRNSSSRTRTANGRKATAVGREGKGKERQGAKPRRPAKVKSAAKAEQVGKPARPDNAEVDDRPDVSLAGGVPDAPVRKVPEASEAPTASPLTPGTDDAPTGEMAAIKARLAADLALGRPQFGAAAAASQSGPAAFSQSGPAAFSQSGPAAFSQSGPPFVCQQPAAALARRTAPPAVSRRVNKKRQALAGKEKTPGRRRVMMAALVVLALFIVTGGAAAIVVVMHKASSAPAGTTPSTAVMQQQEAAQWVTAHVSHGVPVACDKAMCAALAANGFPQTELRVLGPASPPPLSSAVVVETAAVRRLFGTSLSSLYAPAVLAAFGSGDTQINIRVVARQGAAAYERKLAEDRTSRKAAEVALLGANQITVSPRAQAQLLAGEVDSRLLIALTSLASSLPIDIVDFENVGPGAGADMPLRDADLATTDSAAHMSSSAYLQTLQAQLSTGPGAHPTSMTQGFLPGGQDVLRVEFPAPSPLGLLGPQGPPPGKRA